MLPRKRVLSPISVTATYTVLAALWIWTSDSLIVHFGLSSHDAFLFGVVKGTVFVVVTTLVLYILVKSMVSQIERDDATRRTLELRFQQAQRMDALGKLASHIAHDFKNQLMIISGSAELLDVTDEKNHVKRDAIMKAVQRCDKLTRELLAYGRKQDMNPTTVLVGKTIQEIAPTLNAVFGRNISQQIRIDSESSIFIDPLQLEQALMNLALNSKDAMPSGGTFCIEASDLKVESELYQVRVPEGEYVQLAVSDTGKGILDDDLPRLFEPFFTTKKNGTGLGLAAVYGIVKQSGGYIFIESNLGQGTTCRLLFPKLGNID